MLFRSKMKKHLLAIALLTTLGSSVKADENSFSEVLSKYSELKGCLYTQKLENKRDSLLQLRDKAVDVREYRELKREHLARSI